MGFTCCPFTVVEAFNSVQYLFPTAAAAAAANTTAAAANTRTHSGGSPDGIKEQLFLLPTDSPNRRDFGPSLQFELQSRTDYLSAADEDLRVDDDGLHIEFKGNSLVLHRLLNTIPECVFGLTSVLRFQRDFLCFASDATTKQEGIVADSKDLRTLSFPIGAAATASSVLIVRLSGYRRDSHLKRFFVYPGRTFLLEEPVASTDWRDAVVVVVIAIVAVVVVVTDLAEVHHCQGIHRTL